MEGLSKFAWAGVLALVTLGFVQAQQQATGQGQVQKTQAGQGVYQPGFGQNPWFSNQEIRQQLKLTEQQYNQLNSAYANAWKTYQQGLQGLGNNLSNEQRMQQMSQLYQGFNKSFSPVINDALTDAQQRERFNQLYLQYQGYGAFSDPTIQEKLKLTPAQREKLTQYGQEWRQQMGSIGQNYQTNPENATKQYNDLRKQTFEQINGVLTPEQQTQWRQMMGEPYSFQPTIFFQTGIKK